MGEGKGKGMGNVFYGIEQGDAIGVLRTLPDEGVQCCVTSPPYWGLRDYKTEPLVWRGERECSLKEHCWGGELPHGRRGNRGISGTGGNLHPTLDHAGEGAGAGTSGSFCLQCGAWRGNLGLEPTPEMYVEHIVQVFREVRRVLRKDGTVWLNLGDSFASQGGAHGGRADNQSGVGAKRTHLAGGGDQKCRVAPNGLKPKDLIGIPWRVALALQADGWWLRADIIWAKPNPMPESVRDRPTRSHEYLFLLAKSERYYYDAEAVMEECSADMQRRAARGHTRGANGKLDASRQDADSLRGVHAKAIDCSRGRNRRDVWTISTRPYKGAHFATFPPALVEPCILAGCPPGGTVLDPFAGSGTTLMVALEHGRSAIGIELNPEYIKLAEDRIRGSSKEMEAIENDE